MNFRILGLSDKYEDDKGPISEFWQDNIMSEPTSKGCMPDKRNMDILLLPRLNFYNYYKFFKIAINKLLNIDSDIKFTFKVNKYFREYNLPKFK